MHKSTPLIPISFALTPRMQSFVELRDALRCLNQAYEGNAPYAWLVAAKEVHDLMAGESNKKPAIPNIVGLFSALKRHYEDLSNKHPQFKQKLNQACEEINLHNEHIRHDVPSAIDYMCKDAWLTSYHEVLRQQDILGHKLCLPQVIHHLWAGEGNHAQQLNQVLHTLSNATAYLDHMLHAHVPWQERIAKNGSDQITPSKYDDIGLLIVGLPPSTIQQSILPTYSGSRQLVRLRFNQWLPGQPSKNTQQDIHYSLMMVPIS